MPSAAHLRQAGRAGLARLLEERSSSGRQNATSTTPARGAHALEVKLAEVRLSSRKLQRIKEEAVERYVRWDRVAERVHTATAGHVREDHFLIALLMDGVQKHHGKQHQIAVLSNEEADRLFRATLESVLDRVGPKHRLLSLDSLAAFRPDMRATLEVLFKQFDRTPQLRDIGHAYRSRLLIDPQIIDGLERQGIDVANPLLAFIFDASPTDLGGYAHKLAKAWVQVMESSGRRVNIDLIDGVNATSSGQAIADRVVRFGTHSSEAGRLRMAQFMTALHEENFETTMFKNGCAYRQQSGYAMRYEIKGDLGIGKEMLPRIYRTVEEVLAAEIGHDDHFFGGNVFIQFRREMRHSDAPSSQARQEERIKAIRARLSATLAKVDDLGSKTPQQAVLAIAQCYLDCEFLHPLQNGNYRLFGLLLVNLLLARRGLPLAVIEDPNTSDGASYEEVAQMIVAGQARMAQWCAGRDH